LVHYLSVKKSTKQSLPFTLSSQPCETFLHLTHACYMTHHFIIIIYSIALMMIFDAGYHLWS